MSNFLEFNLLNFFTIFWILRSIAPLEKIPSSTHDRISSQGPTFKLYSLITNLIDKVFWFLPSKMTSIDAVLEEKVRTAVIAFGEYELKFEHKDFGEEFVAKARNELRETPENIETGLKELRKLVKSMKKNVAWKEYEHNSRNNKNSSKKKLCLLSSVTIFFFKQKKS